MIENAWPQAAFDPRILQLPHIGDYATKAPGTLFPLVYSNLARGYIKQDKSYYSGPHAPVYACAFLYNPSMVEVSYAIDQASASLTLPQYYRSPDDTGVYRVGLAATVSVNLLFDRTFEVNTGIPQGPGVDQSYPDNVPDPGGSFHPEDPRKIGVQADINALKRITGITSQVSNVAWTDANNNQQHSNLVGPMQQLPAWLHFSDSPAYGPLSYFGFISGMDIQYTHFTQSMTPFRCAVALSFTLLPQVS